MTQDFPFGPDEPIPSNAETSGLFVSQWRSEAEVQRFVQDTLANNPHTRCVIPEMEMIDLFGNRARADFGIVLTSGDTEFIVAVELKHNINFSANAAEGYAQAFHYREMCLISDSRVPHRLRNRSPALAFTGVFEMTPFSGFTSLYKAHGQRLMGMDILSTKFGVGSLRYHPWRLSLDLYLGECWFCTIGTESNRTIQFATGFEKYVTGKHKRNGTRRDRQSVAERMASWQSLFESKEQ